MNPFLPLALKDCRRARWWIAATWFLAALPLAQTLLPGANQANALLVQWPAFGAIVTNAPSIFSWLTLGALIINAARLVHLDPANHSSAFLATRPVSFPDIVRAKLAVIFGLLIIPVAALHVAQIAALRIPLTAADYLLLALETLLRLAAVTFVALIPAFFRKSAGDYLLVVIVGGLALCFLQFVRWDTPAMPILADESYRLGLSRDVLVYLLCAVGALAAIYLFAHTRSLRWTGAAVGLAAAVILPARLFWPVDFLHALTPNPRAPASEWPDTSAIRVQFEKPKYWGGPEPHFSGSGYNGVDYQNLEAFAKFEGVPMPWYPVQRAFRSVLTLGNGTTLPCRGTLGPGINISRWLVEQDLQPRGDEESGIVTPLQLDQYRADAVSQSPQNASVQGEAEVEFRRVVILGELPLREGASFTRNRQRYTLRKISYSEERLQIELVREDIRILLRGEDIGSQSLVQYPLIHKSGHDYVQGSGLSGGNGVSFLNYRQSIERLDYDPNRVAGHDAGIRFTSDWVRGARLLILDTEGAGNMTVPFAFHSFTLRQ